jgi:hypothetical protein
MPFTIHLQGLLFKGLKTGQMPCAAARITYWRCKWPPAVLVFWSVIFIVNQAHEDLGLLQRSKRHFVQGHLVLWSTIYHNTHRPTSGNEEGGR